MSENEEEDHSNNIDSDSDIGGNDDDDDEEMVDAADYQHIDTRDTSDILDEQKVLMTGGRTLDLDDSDEQMVDNSWSQSTICFS